MLNINVISHMAIIMKVKLCIYILSDMYDYRGIISLPTPADLLLDVALQNKQS